MKSTQTYTTQKERGGCIQEDRTTKDSEDERCVDETNPFPILSNKFTNPTIQDSLRTLYTTMEQFYLISHNIKNNP